MVVQIWLVAMHTARQSSGSACKFTHVPTFTHERKQKVNNCNGFGVRTHTFEPCWSHQILSLDFRGFSLFYGLSGLFRLSNVYSEITHESVKIPQIYQRLPTITHGLLIK